MFKKIFLFLDDTLFRVIVKKLYPQYKRPRHGYMYNLKVLIRYAFAQKILRINGSVPWPVHFTSYVGGWENIDKGILCDPGDSLGVYITGTGGLKIGNNVGIAANCTITTANHSKYDQRKLGYRRGIVIGDNVWIGANCNILAGVTIGDNVTIGAGCTIRGDVESNSVVIGGDNSLKVIKKTRDYEYNCLEDELN